jgi:hypothetical protein
VAAVFESKALAASAVLAQGRVRLAEGDAAGARHEFEAARHLWNEVGAPFETALARMGVGDAYRVEEMSSMHFWSSEPHIPSSSKLEQSSRLTGRHGLAMTREEMTQEKAA